MTIDGARSMTANSAISDEAINGLGMVTSPTSFAACHSVAVYAAIPLYAVAIDRHLAGYKAHSARHTAAMTGISAMTGVPVVFQRELVSERRCRQQERDRESKNSFHKTLFSMRIQHSFGMNSVCALSISFTSTSKRFELSRPDLELQEPQD
jgi:hypothetical protein